MDNDIAQIWQHGDPHKLARGFKLSALRKRNVVVLFEAKYMFVFNIFFFVKKILQGSILVERNEKAVF